MTEDDIKRDRATIAASTSGKWSGFRTGILCGTEWVVSNVHDDHGNIMRAVDAEFIAEAHRRWPAALNEIERIQAKSEKLAERVVECDVLLEKRGDEVERLRALLAEARSHVDAAVINRSAIGNSRGASLVRNLRERIDAALRGEP